MEYVQHRNVVFSLYVYFNNRAPKEYDFGYDKKVETTFFIWITERCSWFVASGFYARIDTFTDDADEK